MQSRDLLDQTSRSVAGPFRADNSCWSNSRTRAHQVDKFQNRSRFVDILWCNPWDGTAYHCRCVSPDWCYHAVLRFAYDVSYRILLFSSCTGKNCNYSRTFREFDCDIQFCMRLRTIRRNRARDIWIWLRRHIETLQAALSLLSNCNVILRRKYNTLIFFKVVLSECNALTHS